MPKRLKLSDQVRRAIDRSEMTRYAICKELNFSESVMSRFMAGKSGISMETLDRIADLLDLNIITGKKKPRGRR